MVCDRSAYWAPDPSGRHQHRFWDGSTWTEYVSDRGRPSLDPSPLAVVTAPATALALAPPAQRPAPSAVSPTVSPTLRPAKIPARDAVSPTASTTTDEPRSSTTVEPRPTRGPNRLASHREQRSPLRRSAPPLALCTLLAVVLALAWL